MTGLAILLVVLAAVEGVLAFIVAGDIRAAKRYRPIGKF